MNLAADSAIVDFETYVLITMKFGLLDKQEIIKEKLLEHGLSLAEGEEIYGRMKDCLDGDKHFFTNLCEYLDAPSQNSSFGFDSRLWLGYKFMITKDGSGSVSVARYNCARRVPYEVGEVGQAPLEIAPWSMDVPEFLARFNGASLCQQYSLFDELLPAHEYYEFEWNGDRYGAGFSWGIFLSAARLWG